MRRGLTLAFVVLFASAPLVDAALEAATLDQVIHVEAETDDTCFSGHDEAMCHLCKLLDIPGHVADHTLIRAGGTRVRIAVDWIGHQWGRLAYLAGAPSRAPPTV